MRQRFTATIKGKRYYFIVEETQPDEYAIVDYDRKRVSIAPIVNAKKVEFRVEILIHEALHVLAPEWTEKRVLAAGKDLARLLNTATEI
jgi:hypothetical protein